MLLVVIQLKKIEIERTTCTLICGHFHSINLFVSSIIIGGGGAPPAPPLATALNFNYATSIPGLLGSGIEVVNCVFHYEVIKNFEAKGACPSACKC